MLSIHSLNLPGYHVLQSEGYSLDKSAVNIAEYELNSNLINIDDMSSIISENMIIMPMNKNILSNIQDARIGIELWRYFLYATILLLIFEMILSNAKKQR